MLNWGINDLNHTDGPPISSISSFLGIKLEPFSSLTTPCASTVSPSAQFESYGSKAELLVCQAKLPEQQEEPLPQQAMEEEQTVLPVVLAAIGFVGVASGGCG